MLEPSLVASVIGSTFDCTSIILFKETIRLLREIATTGALRFLKYGTIARAVTGSTNSFTLPPGNVMVNELIDILQSLQKRQKKLSLTKRFLQYR